MAWAYLFTASAAEIVWAYTLKASDGFTRPLWSVVNLVAMLATVWFLAQAVRTLPLGTAYAVWTGIGAFGTALVGILWFGDPATTWRLVFLVLLIGSIIGLKLVS